MAAGFQKMATVGVLTHSIVMIILACRTAIAACPAISGEGKEPALMCLDSVVSGKSVYIDTWKAKDTDHGPDILCSCQVSVIKGKLLNVTVNSSSTNCGSHLILSFNSSAEQHKTAEDCGGLTMAKKKTDTLTVSIEKVQAPHVADYCVHLSLELCGSNEYQCDDGECLSEDSKCDSVPDCKDKDDEASSACKALSCTEGQVACKDGQSCAIRCNEVEECADKSDELQCGDQAITNVTMSTTQVAPSTTEKPVGPHLQVQCFRSNRFSTTTTTTTTTTTSTATTITTSIASTIATSTATQVTSSIITTAQTTIQPTNIQAKSSTIEVEQTTGNFVSATPESMPSSSPSVINPRQQSSTQTSYTTSVLKDEGVPVWKHPGVIAGAVVAGIVVVLLIILVLVRRSRKRRASHDIQPDLWIENNGEKELEPLNTSR